MKTTEYLYGCDITSLPSMDGGLLACIEAATKLLYKLQKVPIMDRDFYRIRSVLEAIEHNTKLLKKEV